jgi:hypothetical protein
MPIDADLEIKPEQIPNENVKPIAPVYKMPEHNIDWALSNLYKSFESHLENHQFK